LCSLSPLSPVKIFSSAISKLAALLLAARAVTAASIPPEQGGPIAGRTSFDETEDLHGYSGENGTPKDLDRKAVTYIAVYLLLLPETFYLDW